MHFVNINSLRFTIITAIRIESERSFWNMCTCSNTHCSEFDTDKNFPSNPKKLEETFNLPDFIRSERYNFQKSHFNSLLTSSRVLHTQSSNIKQASRGFQCCVQLTAWFSIPGIRLGLKKRFHHDYFAGVSEALVLYLPVLTSNPSTDIESPVMFAGG